MRRGTQPTWLIILIAVALVFAGWYLWQGLQTYIRSGGLGVQEAVQQAEQEASATVIRALTSTVIFAPPPTRTPIPECQPFVIVVKEAIVRTEPSREARIKRALYEGDEVCVIAPAATDPDWLLVDEEPRSRRIESVYMHRSLVRAVNPTATPVATSTPLSTITPKPSDTPDPAAATVTSGPTPTQTPVASATSPLRSA